MLNAASEKKLAGVKPDLVKVVRRAAEVTKQPFQIVQGNRTQAEQNALYAQGRTKPGPIVTWTKNSKHIGGNAIDYAALVNGKVSWDERLYPLIALAFKQAARELKVAITWGGDWKTKDWGHVELGGSIPSAVVAATPVYDPMRAVSFFVGRKWSELAARALVASLMWESGGHAKWTIFWDAKGDKDKEGIYRSRYAPQWNGPRITAFERFAARNERDVLDPYIQLAYLDNELNTTEKKAAKALKAAETIEEANTAAISFWRPSIPHAAERLKIAKRLV